MRVVLFVAGVVAMAGLSPVALLGQGNEPADERAEGQAAGKKTVPAAKSPARSIPAIRVVPARVLSAEVEESPLAAPPEVKEIDEKATHRQARVIEVARGSNDTMRVNAFCLDAQGRLLAACGEGPGEVRLLDADGKFLSSWAVPVKPESINVATDGTVLIAGEAKLFRYSPTGKLLQETESPHAVALRANKAKLREQAVQNLSQAANSISSRIATYQQIIDSITKKKEAKEEVNAQEEQILKILPQQLEILRKQQAEQGEKAAPKISEEAIEQQVASLSKNKSRMCSISADKEHVYIATPALVGYGYEVWRMNHEFQSAEVIISGLSGCCGQMDVQASSTGLYVAENSRHRVVRYEANGKLVSTWGKGDRTGVDGFSSCCNPMNVCFSKNGDVFTAESNTGRIKRFTADGTFVDYVGDIKLVPGCKNVSIAVSPDGDRVYMLDITRNHIVLMERKPAAAADTTAAAK